MFGWFGRRRNPAAQEGVSEARLREKYLCFREILALNAGCLEGIIELQRCLQFVPARRDVIGDGLSSIFFRAGAIIDALERLTSQQQPQLRCALKQQREAVERHLASLEQRPSPRLVAWLSEVGAGDSAEVGGKAAALGEVKNRLGLPVPDGFVVTTEAYWRFLGIPHWKAIRDSLSDLDLGDVEGIRRASERLRALVLATSLPGPVESALREPAVALPPGEGHLAMRSSAVGEGPEGGLRTHAGQFLTLLNVPAPELPQAYRLLVAGRFSEQALTYRLSSGLLEVNTPLAVLVQRMVAAVASGVLYTRDPSNPAGAELWITATGGLGPELAAGRAPADLFVVSRKDGRLLSSRVVRKPEEIAPIPGGGTGRRPVPEAVAQTPSLDEPVLKKLAEYGVLLEEYFRAPQDVEWAVDSDGRIWILQTRPLGLVEAGRWSRRTKAKGEALIQGGRTIYPGRVSGPAHLAEHAGSIDQTPPGAILFLRRASAEIVRVFPRVCGVVAESGNIAGHAAALLREFKIPSVFLLEGAFEKIRSGDTVSLDAVQAAVFVGALWPGRPLEAGAARERPAPPDPVSRHVLTLTLLDPAAGSFRAAGCQSTHDVIRFCHERAIEAMFTVNDIVLEKGRHAARRLKTSAPLHLIVLDLGGGLRLQDPGARQVEPAEIVSAPFQAFWRGATHPEVSWRREMPARLTDLASIIASSLPPAPSARALGQESYLLVGEDYMNLNARLAYHFTLIDACLTDDPRKNYVAFRFAGGGATRHRRSLRACFVEECLRPSGFQVDRRGDLVNAWLKRAPARRTEEALDLLGRLTACTSQLDMYMADAGVMRWLVREFLRGNYRFDIRTEGSAAEQSRRSLR